MSHSILDIAKSVGMEREEVATMVATIRANQHRLDTCRGPHDFIDGDMTVPFNRRIATCSLCQGELRIIEVDWYRKGLAGTA